MISRTLQKEYLVRLSGLTSAKSLKGAAKATLVSASQSVRVEEVYTTSIIVWCGVLVFDYTLAIRKFD